MVAIPSKFIQFGGFIWNYLLMLPFQLVCFMYVSFLGFNPSWNSIHNTRWSHLLMREEFCLEFLKNTSVVCFSDTIRCSTCPLVLGCWKLSHVNFLNLRKKELLPKLSKFTKWQLKPNYFKKQFFVIIFTYLSKVIIQVQNDNWVLNRVGSWLKCMELAWWVLQASLNLYYYLR